jgi:hypothetical protein
MVAKIEKKAFLAAYQSAKGSNLFEKLQDIVKKILSHTLELASPFKVANTRERAKEMLHIHKDKRRKDTV